MKKPLLFLALGLSLAFSNAYAATYDATPSGDGFLFSASFSGDNSFNDYIFFNTEGRQNIVASVSGTGDTAFSFKEFNLLDSNKNFITAGTVFNNGAKISFGGLESNQSGSFYLQVIGSSVGATAGYSGTITTAVPEPGTYALMLAGVGLVGVISRKKIRQNTQNFRSISYS